MFLFGSRSQQVVLRSKVQGLILVKGFKDRLDMASLRGRGAGWTKYDLSSDIALYI